MVDDVVLLLDAFETDAVDLLMTEAATAAAAGAPPPASASAASCRKRSVSKCKVLVVSPLLVSVFYDRETD